MIHGSRCRAPQLCRGAREGGAKERQPELTVIDGYYDGLDQVVRLSTA
jgi:hypothetical protein